MIKPTNPVFFGIIAFICWVIKYITKAGFCNHVRLQCSKQFC